MTTIDAQGGYDAFNIQKVMDAVRRVVAPLQGWGGGKPGSSQWAYYDADWGSQEWNWDNEWVSWADESTTLTGNGAECWDDAYDAYLGYPQCKRCLGWGRWGGECPKYPSTDGKWGRKGKCKERGSEKGKEKGKGFGKSKGKGSG